MGKASIILRLAIILVSMSAFGDDLTNPEFVAIKDSYGKAMAAIQNTRTTALTRLIQLQIENADLQLKEKTKTRNITGMAVARNAKTIFEDALTNLAASGTFDLPAKVRRELEPAVTEFKASRQRIEDEFETAKESILNEHLNRFQPLAAKAHPEFIAPAATNSLKMAFDQLIASKVEASPSPTPDQSSSGSNSSAKASSVIPEVLAATGNSPSGWITIGRWTGTVAGMDVVTIPLADMKTGTTRTDLDNPITSRTSHFEYTVVHPFSGKSATPLRLKSVPGKNGVEVLNWPTAGNDYNLELRLTAPAYPSQNAFELQVGAGVEGSTPGIPGAEIEAAPGKKQSGPVMLSVATYPTGATLYLDGTPVKDSKSPCKIPFPPGAHNLRLTLPGYQPMTVAEAEYPTNTVIRWTFIPDPRVISKTITLSADVPQWDPSGVLVPKDSIVVIHAEGLWACEPGGKQCLAAGYPPPATTSDDGATVSESPRQIASANYGALLGKLGKEGPPFVVGQTTRFKAAAKGVLYFDINEAAGKTYRADNQGKLTLKINIFPADTLDPAP